MPVSILQVQAIYNKPSLKSITNKNSAHMKRTKLSNDNLPYMFSNVGHTFKTPTGRKWDMPLSERGTMEMSEMRNKTVPPLPP